MFLCKLWLINISSLYEMPTSKLKVLKIFDTLKYVLCFILPLRYNALCDIKKIMLC